MPVQTGPGPGGQPEVAARVSLLPPLTARTTQTLPPLGLRRTPSEQLAARLDAGASSSGSLPLSLPGSSGPTMTRCGGSARKSGTGGDSFSTAARQRHPSGTAAGASTTLAQHERPTDVFVKGGNSFCDEGVDSSDFSSGELEAPAEKDGGGGVSDSGESARAVRCGAEPSRRRCSCRGRGSRHRSGGTAGQPGPVASSGLALGQVAGPGAGLPVPPYGPHGRPPPPPPRPLRLGGVGPEPEPPPALDSSTWQRSGWRNMPAGVGKGQNMQP